MATNRKIYSAAEKANIALEALKGNMTINEITARYGPHATQISNWKKLLKSGVVDIFQNKKRGRDADQEFLIEELYKTIGRQKQELDWLKKKSELFGS
jgi:transposase